MAVYSDRQLVYLSAEELRMETLSVENSPETELAELQAAGISNFRLVGAKSCDRRGRPSTRTHRRDHVTSRCYSNAAAVLTKRLSTKS